MTKFVIKFCSVAAAIAVIVFAQLGPGDWQLRTGLGWQTEHASCFVVRSIACLVWPRKFVVGPALMSASMCWRPCFDPIFWPDCMAQVVHSGRLCSLSF